MRVIKFRCWDKKNNRMFKLGDFTIESDGGKVLGFNRNLSGNHSEDENDFDIMQFTGLLDKNGKEIYEGDIVTHKQSPYPCQIIYKQRQAQFMARELTGYHAKVWQIKEKKVTAVIGNIHENKDLLVTELIA